MMDLDGIPLCELVPGRVLMGDRQRHRGTPSREIEYARFTAVLSQPIWMGIYPITQGDWERIIGDGRHARFAQDPDNVIVYPLDPQCPAAYISARDADAFCLALSRKTGERVRLPTEAEWEYAIKAGRDQRHSWGDDESEWKGQVWCEEELARNRLPRQLTRVGQKPANAFGIGDLGCLVQEWIADGFYTDDSGLSLLPGSYPIGQEIVDPISAGPQRMTKGSSIFCSWRLQTTTQKNLGDPDYFHSVSGFRIVVERAKEHAFTVINRPLIAAQTKPPKPHQQAKIDPALSCWVGYPTRDGNGLVLDQESRDFLDARIADSSFTTITSDGFARRFAPIQFTPAHATFILHHGSLFWVVRYPELDEHGLALPDRRGIHFIKRDGKGKLAHAFIPDRALMSETASDVLENGWGWSTDPRHTPEEGIRIDDASLLAINQFTNEG